MDILAIDIGFRSVGLCKWDGQTLHAEKWPVESPDAVWPRWIGQLRPARPYQVLCRCTHPRLAEAVGIETLSRLALRHGARWVHVMGEEIAGDPALAAARQAADEHRLGAAAVVEVGNGRATVALLDAHRRAVALQRPALSAKGTPALEVVAGALGCVLAGSKQHAGADNLSTLPLICFGGGGPPLAARLAERVGLRTILVPDRAGMLATVGMLLANRILHVRSEVPAAPLNVPDLRRAFLRLMDEAYGAISREGYDLDDAVCRRFAELACPGEASTTEVACDDLADATRVLEGFHASRAADTGAHGTVEVRAIRVTAVIETRRPRWPVSPAPTSDLGAARVHQQGEGTTKTVVYERDRLPAGAVVRGPASIREAYSETVVPAGWSASRTDAAGLRLCDERS